jgi:predicted nucleotidyltransferase
MVSLTKNEAGTVNFLIRNFSQKYNINQLSRELKLSPRGIFKILKKLESKNYLISTKNGNNMFYDINFNSEEAMDMCKFVLAEEKQTPFIKVKIDDLKELKKIVDLAILFGSVLTKEKEANDVDVILVFNEKKFSEVERGIQKINLIAYKKLHAVYQTKKDFIENIKRKDKVIISAIKTGIIVWGRDLFMEALKHGRDGTYS